MTNMSKFNKELEQAAEKNPLIRVAIENGLNYELDRIPRVNKRGRVVVEPGVIFPDGTQTRLRKSRYTDGVSPVYVCDNMTGKMENIACIGTSVLLNEYCQARQKNVNSICHDCYAENVVNMYSDLEKNLAANTELLTNRILPDELIPHFITDVVRFEPFGDLNNIIQYINYIKIARCNPGTYFTLWTKNDFIVRLVHRFGISKPKNLHLIKSSQYVNKITHNPETELFDATFTVYDKKFLADHGYNETNFINCGGRKCRKCMNCYGKRVKNRTINERKK